MNTSPFVLQYSRELSAWRGMGRFSELGQMWWLYSVQWIFSWPNLLEAFVTAVDTRKKLHVLIDYIPPFNLLHFGCQWLPI